MLTITLDEGQIFDIISILNVKILKSSGQTKDNIIQNYQFLSNEIKNQIGESLFNKIICSDEYKDLFNANKKTFEAVDLAKTDLIRASEAYMLNNDRFNKKIALQNKFFNSPCKEVKI